MISDSNDYVVTVIVAVVVVVDIDIELISDNYYPSKKKVSNLLLINKQYLVMYFNHSLNFIIYFFKF